MATVDELKAKLAAIEAELIPLKAASEAAHIKTNQAQAALDAYYNTPGHISLNAKINAQKALAADPTNVQLQQNLASINSQWAKQSAELGPLLAARDAAFADEVKTRAPMVAKDAEAGQIELEIAKIDPSQATPEAVAYLKENGELPITSQSDPALTTTSTNNISSPNSVQTIDPNADPNTNIGAEVQVNNNSTVVDDGSDPFVSNGTTTIDRLDTNSVIDDGSDPYVSNGNTTIDTVTSPSSITENVFDPSGNNGAPQVEENVFDPTGNGGAPQGISKSLNNTRSTATKQDSANFQQKPDWRARLSLAPNANYLYKVPKGSAGILEPLQATDGVIFPYTPGIAVTYSAGYDASELIHSNYKVYQYKGSSVDTVSITADFTAQDTTEANYLLAVIHFFRSVTKMFYGQDQNPNNGVPPPLCYLSGFGAYTFDAHPLVVTNFTYTTPTEVDYIRAGSQTNQPGVNVAQQNNIVNSFVPSVLRTAINGLAPKVPNFSTQNSLINSDATYVPTKLQLQITCIPIVTRNDISNKFSLKEYATGALLRGSKRSGGGIW